MGDPDEGAVAQPMATTRPAPDQGVSAGLQVVVVVRQGRDVDEALDGQFRQAAEQPEILDSHDDRVERVADVVFQVGEELHADQLALRGVGPTLGAGTVLAQHDQLVRTVRGLLPFEPGDQLAMHLQIGIAADRRGEVAIVRARQRVMSLGFGRVIGLLQAAEQPVVDRVLFRLARRFFEDALEFEPALRLVDRQAQAAGELGELVELEGLGVGVGAPEEEDPFCPEAGRDGLVRRQHELLDDLVALVVGGEVRAGDLALIAQLDLDLGKVQLQRTTGEAALAEDHGQLEHLAQHPSHRGSDSGMHRRGGVHDRRTPARR